MISYSTLLPVSDVGTYLVVIPKRLFRRLSIKYFPFCRAVRTIHLSSFRNVLDKSNAESRLKCEMADFLHYLISQVVPQRNVSLDGGPKKQVCHLQSEERLQIPRKVFLGVNGFLNYIKRRGKERIAPPIPFVLLAMDAALVRIASEQYIPSGSFCFSFLFFCLSFSPKVVFVRFGGNSRIFCGSARTKTRRPPSGVAGPRRCPRAASQQTRLSSRLRGSPPLFRFGAFLLNAMVELRRFRLYTCRGHEPSHDVVEHKLQPEDRRPQIIGESIRFAIQPIPAADQALESQRELALRC
jgi:hypothetical protein